MSLGRDFIGPFQLLKLIRAGTSTQVWEGLKSGSSKRIALKVLMDDFRTDKGEIDQLKHEALVGSEIKHKNVIQIHGYHDDQGYPLVSMQLCKSRNLKIELRENRDKIEMWLPKIIRGCVEGLGHMHSKGWVHCDVKPDNFLVDLEGNLLVIDFSIAVKLKPKQGAIGKLFSRKPKQARGTRSYMAPEQIRREQPDARTDVYGLGCVIFEMVAGKVPFTGNSADELLNRHLHAAPPSLESCSNATKEFAELIRKTMAKKPEDRFPNMKQLLAALKKVEIYKAGKRPENFQR